MKAGSCATVRREPGQVRKEAAISGSTVCRRGAWLEPKAQLCLGLGLSKVGPWHHFFVKKSGASRSLVYLVVVQEARDGMVFFHVHQLRPELLAFFHP